MVSESIKNIKEFITETHPQGKSLNWDIYKGQYSLPVYIQKNLAKLKDAHTEIVLDHTSFTSAPIRLEFINRKLYITASNSSKTIGKEIKRINNHSVKTIVKIFEPFVSREHDNRLYVSIRHLIVIKSFFNDLIGSTMKLSLKDTSNDMVITFDGSNIISWRDLVNKPQENTNISVTNEGNYSYVLYNACTENGPGEFEREVAKLRNSERVIIDLRRNGGGNSEIINPLYKLLHKYNSVIVLISKYTFSSAIMNAIKLKKEHGAILVGEETAQTLSCYGEVKRYTEPVSMLTTQCSTKFFDAGSKGILKPDYYVLENATYLTRHVDTVLEFAKKLQT